MEAIHVLGCRSMGPRGNAAAITLLSLLLGGCASMAIQAEQEPTVSLDTYGTYLWSPIQRDPGDVRVTAALMAQIRDDITRTWQTRATFASTRMRISASTTR